MRYKEYLSESKDSNGQYKQTFAGIKKALPGVKFSKTKFDLLDVANYEDRSVMFNDDGTVSFIQGHDLGAFKGVGSNNQFDRIVNFLKTGKLK